MPIQKQRKALTLPTKKLSPIILDFRMVFIYMYIDLNQFKFLNAMHQNLFLKNKTV